MQDRVSLYPGRVKLVPVAGQENTYDMVRADEPTQEGTPLNKASLLTDTTAALFGLGSDAVPDDAFSLLSRFHSGLGNEHIWAKSDGNYVNAPDANAYPPSEDDGYEYKYMGQVGGLLCCMVFGTATCNASNGNKTIELGFKPKLVIAYNYGNNTNSLYWDKQAAPRIVVPVILSQAYTTSPWALTETGFTFYAADAKFTNFAYVAFM